MLELTGIPLTPFIISRAPRRSRIRRSILRRLRYFYSANVNQLWSLRRDSSFFFSAGAVFLNCSLFWLLQRRVAAFCPKSKHDTKGAFLRGLTLPNDKFQPAEWGEK